MKTFKVLGFLSAAFFIVTAQSSEQNFTVLDVRTSKEYQESHLKDSVPIDFLASDFKANVSKLDKTKSYKLYCRSGNRSAKALAIMKAQGFKDLENLGSLHEASTKLKRTCEGAGAC